MKHSIEVWETDPNVYSYHPVGLMSGNSTWGRTESESVVAGNVIFERAAE